MWLMTTIGFFSVVCKPGDEADGMLTIRGRVQEDLASLRKAALPEMGPITAHAGTDYRFRARAPREAVARAMSTLAMEVDYANFKDEVARRNGKSRAALYGEVWSLLYELQRERGASRRTREQPPVIATPERPA